MHWKRTGLFVLTFLVVGPLCGLGATLTAMDASMLWDGGRLKANQSMLFAVTDSGTSAVMVMLAYVTGAVPAALSGAYVAWRSRGSHQVSLTEGTLVSLGFGLVFGGIVLAALLSGTNPSRWRGEALLLASPASLTAGLVCTWLTRRWQGPQT